MSRATPSFMVASRGGTHVAYSVTKNTKIFVDATVRSEFHAPTIFNKITEKNGPPYVGTGDRRWESAALGFSWNFGDR